MYYKVNLFEFFRFTGVFEYNRGAFLCIITRVKNILNCNNKRFRLIKVGSRDRKREYTLIFLKERKKKESKQQANKQVQSCQRVKTNLSCWLNINRYHKPNDNFL